MTEYSADGQESEGVSFPFPLGLAHERLTAILHYQVSQAEPLRSDIPIQSFAIK